jgi:hypothetical protein
VGGWWVVALVFRGPSPAGIGSVGRRRRRGEVVVVDLEEGGRRRSSSLAGLVEQAGRAEDRVDGGGGGPHRHRRKPEGAGDYCVALPQESERSGAEWNGTEPLLQPACRGRRKGNGTEQSRGLLLLQQWLSLLGPAARRLRNILRRVVFLALLRFRKALKAPFFTAMMCY